MIDIDTVDAALSRRIGYTMQVRFSSFAQVAQVRFPTRLAEFLLMGFEGLRSATNARRSEPETALALVMGSIADLRGSSPIVRIHSQCITGDVFHSLRCDCRDQLELALQAIASEGAGILIYEQQEGRGIGLLEKLRAYALQDQGSDTVEANLLLGHAVDLRDYALPVEILKFLRIFSIRLMTNNPAKLRAFASSGIRIRERLSAGVSPNQHSAHYLRTKREKMGHLLEFLPEEVVCQADGDMSQIRVGREMTGR